MQMLEECASCIDQALEQLPLELINLDDMSISNRMKKLVIISKLKMQFCAILSQIHRHKDALEQARESVRLNHLLINDLRELCVFYIKREDLASVVAPVQTADGPTDHYNSYQSHNKSRSQSSRNRSFSNFLS